MAGTLTRLQMAQEALDNIAKTGVLTLQSGVTLSSRMSTYINRAQFHISRKADFLQTTSTADTIADQLEYAFPDRFRTIYDMRLEDGTNTRKLICVTPEEFDLRVPKPDTITSGRSWYYVPYRLTGTFQLFPIPDATYTLRLRWAYFPAQMTTDTSVSDYTDLDDCIVAFATMYGFRWLQELKDAAYWEQVGNQIIKDHDSLIGEIYPDWSPKLEGFSVSDGGYTGDYYNNPFIRSSQVTDGAFWR